MNTENVLKLANFLDTVKPVKFNMRAYAGKWAEDKHGKFIEDVEIEELGECGTVGCIAGWAAHLAIKEGVSPQSTIYQIAKDYLELDAEQVDQLFFARWSPRYERFGGIPEDVTPQEAAAELRRLVAQYQQELNQDIKF